MDRVVTALQPSCGERYQECKRMLHNQHIPVSHTLCDGERATDMPELTDA
jgi:hypothetical protein